VSSKQGDKPPDLITVKDAAKHIHVSVRTIQRGIESGDYIVYEKRGKIKYLSAEQVARAYQAQLQVHGTSDQLLRSRLQRIQSHNRRLEQKLRRLQGESLRYDECVGSWALWRARISESVRVMSSGFARKLAGIEESTQVGLLLSAMIDEMMQGVHYSIQ
jgi:hypothetical protein